MAQTIRIKRGLKANVASLELLPGELGVTLDTRELYVGDVNGTPQLVQGAAAGVVESAEKLATARNISVSGDATGSAAFDGSKDATIALTLATSGVEAGTYNNVTVNAKGIVTSGSNKTYTIEDITGLSDALDAKANADDVYSKSEVDAKINAKDSLPTQTGNAGKFLTTDGSDASWAEVDLSSKADVTSVYTKDETNNLLDSKADASTTTAALNAKADASEVEALTTAVNDKANKAATLAGYGINDAYTKDEVDGMVAGTFHFEGEAASYEALPADAEKGDVYQVEDKEYAWDGTEWVELGFNVDLSSYATTEAVAATYATQAVVTEGLNTKANSSDVYTKNEIDQKLALKADKATTLTGYGIEDAYTKNEIDTKVSTINDSLATKLDANSVIDGGTFE